MLAGQPIPASGNGPPPVGCPEEGSQHGRIRHPVAIIWMGSEAVSSALCTNDRIVRIDDTSRLDMLWGGVERLLRTMPLCGIVDVLLTALGRHRRPSRPSLASCASIFDPESADPVPPPEPVCPMPCRTGICCTPKNCRALRAAYSAPLAPPMR